jgi:TetR/AcrR family transcriptional repressor of mexJK operon
MKDWSDDHPKAKLMARKRAAILAAARDAFLKLGYEGTSMEGIAAAADVSIMTLYRHAESKNDLFASVIASACDPNDAEEMAEFAKLLKRPLHEVLVTTGLMAQQRLADPETVALLRAVMAETARFPELAETAYRGFVGHLEGMIEHVLAEREESAGLSKAERRKLAGTFIDRLFGSDMLRVLLGLSGVSPTEQRRRAERARDEVMAAVARAGDARQSA